MLTGRCTYPVGKGLGVLYLPVRKRLIRELAHKGQGWEDPRRENLERVCYAVVLRSSTAHLNASIFCKCDWARLAYKPAQRAMINHIEAVTKNLGISVQRRAIGVRRAIDRQLSLYGLQTICEAECRYLIHQESRGCEKEKERMPSDRMKARHYDDGVASVPLFIEPPGTEKKPLIEQYNLLSRGL